MVDTEALWKRVLPWCARRRCCTDVHEVGKDHLGCNIRLAVLACWEYSIGRNFSQRWTILKGPEQRLLNKLKDRISNIGWLFCCCC